MKEKINTKLKSCWSGTSSWLKSLAKIITLHDLIPFWSPMRRLQIVVVDVILGTFGQSIAQSVGPLIANDLISSVRSEQTVINNLFGSSLAVREYTIIYFAVYGYAWAYPRARTWLSLGAKQQLQEEFLRKYAKSLTETSTEAIHDKNKKNQLDYASIRAPKVGMLYDKVATSVWPGITNIWLGGVVIGIAYAFQGCEGQPLLALAWTGAGVLYVVLGNALVSGAVEAKQHEWEQVKYVQLTDELKNITNYKSSIEVLNRESHHISHVDQATSKFITDEKSLDSRIALVNLILEFIPLALIAISIAVKLVDGSGSNICDADDITLMLLYIYPYFKRLSLTRNVLRETQNLLIELEKVQEQMSTLDHKPKPLQLQENSAPNPSLHSEQTPVLRVWVSKFGFANDSKSSLEKIEPAIALMPNSTCSLVGFSGIGKTTILNLILKLVAIPPEYTKAIKIELHGKDICNFTKKELHDQVAYLPQKIQVMLDKSLRFNLCYADPTATDEILSDIALADEIQCKYPQELSLLEKIHDHGFVKYYEVSIFEECAYHNLSTLINHEKKHKYLWPNKKNNIIQIKAVYEEACEIITQLSLDDLPALKKALSLILKKASAISKKVEALFEKNTIHKDLKKQCDQLSSNLISKTQVLYDLFVNQYKLDPQNNRLTKLRNLESKLENFTKRCIDAVNKAGLKEMIANNRLKPDAIKKVSGGQQQRIGIARLFMKEQATLFLLDEPTSALDPYVRHTIVTKFLESMPKNCAALFITHDYQLTRYISTYRNNPNNKIYVMGRKCDSHKSTETTPTDSTGRSKTQKDKDDHVIGTLVEQGTYDQLVNAEYVGFIGLYKDLLAFDSAMPPSHGDKIIMMYRNCQNFRTNSDELQKEHLSSSNIIEWSTNAKQTAGYGNCFFHASVGTLQNGQYYCQDAMKYRHQWHLALSLFQSLKDPQMPQTFHDCVLKIFEILLSDNTLIQEINFDGLQTEIRRTKDKLRDIRADIQAKKLQIMSEIRQGDAIIKDVFCIITHHLLNKHFDFTGKTYESSARRLQEWHNNQFSNGLSDENIWQLRPTILSMIDDTQLDNLLHDDIVEFIAFRYGESTSNELNSHNVLQEFYNSPKLYKEYCEVIQRSDYYVFTEEIPVLCSILNQKIHVGVLKNGRVHEAFFEPDPALVHQFADNKNPTSSTVTIYLENRHYSRVRIDLQHHDNLTHEKQKSESEIKLKPSSFAKQGSSSSNIIETFPTHPTSPKGHFSPRIKFSPSQQEEKNAGEKPVKKMP